MVIYLDTQAMADTPAFQISCAEGQMEDKYLQD